MIRLEFLERVQRMLLAVLVIVVLSVVSLSAHAIWTWHRAVEDSNVEDLTPEASAPGEGLSSAAPAVPGGDLSPEGKPLIGTIKLPYCHVQDLKDRAAERQSR